MGKAKARKRQPLNPPAEPAIITPMHRKDRHFIDDQTKKVSQQRAWRKLSPLEACYAKNQLVGGNPAYSPINRYEAGKAYTEMFDLSQKSGRDSTQALNMTAPGGFGAGTLSQASSTALTQRISIESHMGARDRQIIRMVCGEGYQPAEAVRHVCGDYQHTVAARFREALDALIEAMETARRYPGSFAKHSSAQKVA